ncbi:hypothetical protein ICN42_06255, partial [Polynucleobacter sp. 71A-WALBACH]|uniref:VCBS domain-containing protein n=1 Tax=Polynucleobacter sp. 71A-WALBACH TaxID=2689097 RepID=UPI001C0CEC24
TASAVQSLAKDAEVNDTFTVKVDDGKGGVDAQVVTIKIVGTNDAAVISGESSGTITETDAAQSIIKTLTSTDIDGTANKFIALASTAGNGGYGHFTMTEGGTWTYSMDNAHDEFVKDQKYTDSVTVKAADGTEKLISVTITGADEVVQQPCDSEVPTISSLSISDATGIQNKYLNKDDEVTIKVHMSENIFVTGTPGLQININGSQVNTTYVDTSGSDIYFKYKILDNQNDSDGISIDANKLNISSASIKDSAGNNANLTYSAVGNNSDYKIDTAGPSTGVKQIGVDGPKFKAELTKALSSDEVVSYSFDNLTWKEVVNVKGTVAEVTQASNTKIYMKVEDLAGNSSSVLSYTAPKKPIALDLDSDNQISYLDQSAGVTYQFSDTSELVSTAWVASNDGLLARQESNGSLNIVFSTQNDETDLQGLAKVFDSNQDGILSATDSEFSTFGVWQDANSNAVVDAGEFSSLTDRGIVSLSLVSNGLSSTAANGDVLIYGQTDYAQANGDLGVAEDVAFITASVSDVASAPAVDIPLVGIVPEQADIIPA